MVPEDPEGNKPEINELSRMAPDDEFGDKRAMKRQMRAFLQGGCGEAWKLDNALTFGETRNS